MLRITTNETPQVVTLRLEGRLEGPWVALLVNCWHRELALSGKRRRRVDLNGLTFIDAEGKAVLARMLKERAEFIGGDLVTKAVISEIVGR
jgi:hypothetical protein